MNSNLKTALSMGTVLGAVIGAFCLVLDAPSVLLGVGLGCVLMLAIESLRLGVSIEEGRQKIAEIDRQIEMLKELSDEI